MNELWTIWTHKRHPIAHPLVWTMGCLLRELWKNRRIIKVMYCIIMDHLGYCLSQWGATIHYNIYWWCSLNSLSQKCRAAIRLSLPHVIKGIGSCIQHAWHVVINRIPINHSGAAYWLLSCRTSIVFCMTLVVIDHSGHWITRSKLRTNLWVKRIVNVWCIHEYLSERNFWQRFNTKQIVISWLNILYEECHRREFNTLLPVWTYKRSVY